LQEAIHSVRAFDPEGPTTIYVKNGIYREKIVIPDYVCNIAIIGEDKEKTIISYDDYAGKENMGTFRSYTLQVRGNDIRLENLTIENAAGPVGQAVALHTEGDRIIIKNCRLLGNQDTVYTGGEGNRLCFIGVISKERRILFSVRLPHGLKNACFIAKRIRISLLQVHLKH